MKKIVITNEKGGIGKSSIAVHLAQYAYEQGLKVLFIETDKQANSSYSLDQVAQVKYSTSLLFSENPSIEYKNFVLFYGDKSLKSLFDPTMPDFKVDMVFKIQDYFRQNIQTFSEHFDICIFDTPPADGAYQRLPLIVSDFAVAPFTLDKYSALGIKGIIQTTQEIKETNPKIQFLGLLPNMVNQNSKAQKDTLVQLQEKLSHLLLDKEAYISLRGSISEANEQQIPVWKVKKTAAKQIGQKIKQINALILKKMGV